MKLRAALAFCLALFFTAQARAGEVERWNRIATDATAAEQIDPLSESRILAIVHASIHDALNGVQRQYEPYRARLHSPSGASAESAVAAAAHASLSKLIPAHKAQFDAALADVLEHIEDRNAAFAGMRMGREAAGVVLKARADDGASRSVAYVPGKNPGDYRPTPPDFTPAFAAQWGAVRPFVLASSAQFRPGPPPSVKSVRARSDIEEARIFGGKTSQRTDEQSEIARFWYESSP